MKACTAVLGAGLLVLTLSGCTKGDPAPEGPPAPPPIALAARVAECDALATHADDPEKSDAPGVDDEKIDSVKAIPGCAEAADANPTITRLRFQLGRAYWSAERFEEAIEAFIAAGELGHGGALAYLADAALYGVAGLDPDPEAAKGLYDQAATAGFKPAAALAADIVAGAQPAPTPPEPARPTPTYRYPAMIAALSEGVAYADGMSDGHALFYYAWSLHGVREQCPGAVPGDYDIWRHLDRDVLLKLDKREGSYMAVEHQSGRLKKFTEEAMADGRSLARGKGCQAPETRALVKAVMGYL